MARPPEILVADEIVANPKLAHQAESPASSTGIPASHGNIPSYPLVPTTPASPVQHRRHGSIIKKTPRSDFAAKSTPSYRMRDRSAPRVGRWVFIVNGTKQKQWDELSSRLLRQLSGVEWRVHITQSKGHARKLAYRAAQRGADLIAAVGGDGTLNEVVDGVMHAGVLGADGLPRAVITVLPLGSASDFHRTMAWEPDNFEEAMWRIGKRGSTAVLDVARVQCEGPDGPVDRHFINVASCGASAKAALAVDKWKWMGKKGKYRMAALAALMKHAPRTLGIRVDNGEWQKVSGATMVAIGNGSYFGHGLNITPDASPYSGTLQVVTARRMGVVDFILKSWRLKMGKHLDLKGFSAQEGSKIEVAPWKARRTEPEMPSFVAGAGGDLAAGAISREASMASMTSMTPRQPSEDSATGFAAAGPSAGPSRTASMSETEGAASQWSGSEGSLRKGRGFFPRRRSSGSLAGSEAKGKDGGKGKDGKEAAIDYGPVPLELDGEVVGWAPFAVTVLPGAIKFRV